MTTARELTRVLNGRRQVMLPCPRCRQLIGLWLCILPPGEYLRLHPATDLTASLLPPAERARAMQQSAENAEKSSAVPWVTCAFCGLDDHYVFGVPELAEAVTEMGT